MLGMLENEYIMCTYPSVAYHVMDPWMANCVLAPEGRAARTISTGDMD